MTKIEHVKKERTGEHVKKQEKKQEEHVKIS